MKPFLFVILFASLLTAQDLTSGSETVQEPLSPPVSVEESLPHTTSEEPTTPPEHSFSSMGEELASLSALNDSITLRENKRDEIYQQMQDAVDPVQREKLVPELNKLNSEIASLRRRFQSIAVKTDLSVFEKEPAKEFNWQTELGQLLEPLMKELETATKESRERGELKDQLEEYQLKQRTSQKALNSLEPLLEAETDNALKQRLEELKEIWEDRLRDAENQITVVEHQLNQRDQEQVSPIEKTREIVTGFIRTRGMNLTLGVLAFVCVFLLMRGLQNLWAKMKPSRKKGRSFSSRLSSLIWTILTILMAMGAMVGTFNLTGDWFLLSLTILFLLGVGWAGMKALPGMLELFRMMLNMGAVREDERLVYEGLPWKVNSISFRTELLNPQLNGGVLTLPTHMLVGLLSRPPGDDEEWFPSRKDDWVLLGDGTFGRVSHQTPSSVQVVNPGGSQRTYTTLQYLELSPTVLSTGFRREITFGLDYQHIADASGKIPELMQEHLEKSLASKLGEDLQHLSVQFSEAGDSALKFCVIVDCDGNAAKSWPYLPMWVQMALVDLCNAQGWSIPFPQLQVHTDN